MTLAGCRPSPATPFPTAYVPATPVLPAPTATSTPLPSPTLPPTATPTETPIPTVPPSPTAPPVITLVFTGQIVPARCVQAAIEEAGNADYIFDDVRELISSSDLAVGTLNASLSDYPPATGCKMTFVMVGRPESADAMASAGFDVLSVATSHIKNCGLTNCGDRAFLDTLANLLRVGILPVGAGMNLAEAVQPVVVEVRGVRFAFISLGNKDTNPYAGEASPGIGILTEEALRASIAAAQEVADVVIVLPQWGPEYSHTPNPEQLRLARVAAEAGADVIVGNHTHYIQGYEAIDGLQVFYSLGNFVFDQETAITEHGSAVTQSAILRITFEGTEYVRHEFIPTVVDRTGHVHIASQEEAVEILTRLDALSEDLK